MVRLPLCSAVIELMTMTTEVMRTSWDLSFLCHLPWFIPHLVLIFHSFQSSSNEFYEMELEHERLQREKREKAEAEDSAAEVLRRQRLLAAKTLEGFYSGGAVNLPEVLREATVNATSSTVAATSLDSAIASIPPPPRSEVAITSGGPKNVLESKHRFLPPPSGTALPRNAPASSFAMPPPTSAMRWGAVPPSSAAFITPASGFVGISPGVPGGVIGGPGWVGPDFYAPGQPRKVQEDTVVLRKPKQSKLVSSTFL